MTKTHESLNELLNTEFIEEVEETDQDMEVTDLIEYEESLPEPVEVDPHAGEDEEDYVLARNTYHNLLGQGDDAIENLLDIARNSEEPRAYEVASQLIKSISDATKDMYALHEKRKKLREIVPESPQTGGTTVNVDKAVFVGTPADNLKRMKQRIAERNV